MYYSSIRTIPWMKRGLTWMKINIQDRLVQEEASNFYPERFKSFLVFMSPFSFLFFISIITGTLIAISRSNWVYLWIGIEINLLSFIPLISSYQMFQETEARVKYFIIQAIGRGLILTRGIIAINVNLNAYTTYITSIIFIIRMLIKLGIAPFHSWLPHVITSIPWSLCITLATIQKIAPIRLIIIIVSKDLSLILILSVVIRAVVGGVGGINQSQIRGLIAYSSIGHIGWILSTVFCSTNIFLFYFSRYIVISIALIIIFINESLMKSNYFNFILLINPIRFILVIVVVFRLGGLPPLLGFFPKWIIITEISINILLITRIIILGSLMNLFYYFNITFNFVISMKPTLSRERSVSLISILLVGTRSISPLIIII